MIITFDVSPPLCYNASTAAYNRFTEVILDIVREPNGDWKKGHTGNPRGRPPSVFASQNDVADRLLQKYSPSEIIAIAGDPARLDAECSSFQAIILIQLANALSARNNNDNALERERLLDRVVGKPLQKVEQKISVSIETENALLEGRRRVAKARAPLDVSYSVIQEVTNLSEPGANLVQDSIGIDVARNESESELSSAEKSEARRIYARDYARRKAAERKAAGVVKPSFNERLAMRNTEGIVTNDDKSE